MTYPRSPHDTEGGLSYLPRMLDKIRMDMKGELDAGYRPRLGQGMDGLLCQFLGVQYDKVKMQVVEGKTDADILAWCLNQGTQRSEYDFMLFNKFLEKLGWRDEVYGKRLNAYKVGLNISDRDDIETLFDFIEFDEGRKE